MLLVQAHVGALDTMPRSSTYSQYASNSPRSVTSPPATRRSVGPVAAMTNTGAPGARSSEEPSGAADKPPAATRTSARPLSKSCATMRASIRALRLSM